MKISFIIRNDLLSEALNSQKLVKYKSYVAYEELFTDYMQKVFNLKERPGKTLKDPRPDLYFTPGDLDRVLKEQSSVKGLNKGELENAEDIISFTKLLRQTIENFEKEGIESKISASPIYLSANPDEKEKAEKRYDKEFFLYDIGIFKQKDDYEIKYVRPGARQLAKYKPETYNLDSDILSEEKRATINLPKIRDLITKKPGVKPTTMLERLVLKSEAADNLRNKGKKLFTQFIVNNGSSLSSYTVFTTGSFKPENLVAEIDRGEIKFKYTDAYEKKLALALSEQLINTHKKVIPIVADIVIAKLFSTNKGNKNTFIKELQQTISMSWMTPSGGSIPIGNLKPADVTKLIPRRRKGSKSAFTSRVQSVLEVLRRTKVSDRQMSLEDRMSDNSLASLVKREMMRRMPIGPVGGKPLSSSVLTYRTGNFVKSLDIVKNNKTKRIRYYYDKSYWKHELTSRDPRNLIVSSINSVVYAMFENKYVITKSNRRL